MGQQGRRCLSFLQVQVQTGRSEPNQNFDLSRQFWSSNELTGSMKAQERARANRKVTDPLSGFTTMARGRSCSPFRTTPTLLPSMRVTLMTLVASLVQ